MEERRRIRETGADTGEVRQEDGGHGAPFIMHRVERQSHEQKNSCV